MESPLEFLAALFSSWTTWTFIGLAGQALFFSRFLVQWLYSERHKKSLIPVAFWYFSLGGGMILLSYAIHVGDPVFIVGQSGGLLIYSRNLWFIYSEKRKNNDPTRLPAVAESDKQT